jgi:hypothetical protein
MIATDCAAVVNANHRSSMKLGLLYQMSPSTWCFKPQRLSCKLLSHLWSFLQVIVPLNPLTPRPYTSTAHLPTPYAHRLVSQFNMSLYAQRRDFDSVNGSTYPSGPPGEATWPTFLQVLAPSCHLIAHFGLQLVRFYWLICFRDTVLQCHLRQMLPASPLSTTLGSLTFPTAQFFRFQRDFCPITLCCDADGTHVASLQVVFAFAPGVSGAVWSNISAIPVLGG